MGKPMLKKGCDCHNLMVSKIVNQDVDFNLTPKEIWSSEPLFQEFPLTTWRACWNRLKAEHGINVRATASDGNPNVAGAASIAEARDRMANVSVANMQNLKQPPPAPKKEPKGNANSLSAAFLSAE